MPAETLDTVLHSVLLSGDLPYFLQDIQCLENGSEEASGRLNQTWDRILVASQKAHVSFDELVILIERRKEKMGIRIKNPWKNTLVCAIARAAS